MLKQSEIEYNAKPENRNQMAWNMWPWHILLCRDKMRYHSTLRCYTMSKVEPTIRRANRRIAGLVIPWMLSLSTFLWRLAPPLPSPLPPLPRPDILYTIWVWYWYYNMMILWCTVLLFDIAIEVLNCLLGCAVVRWNDLLILSCLYRPNWDYCVQFSWHHRLFGIPHVEKIQYSQSIH